MSKRARRRRGRRLAVAHVLVPLSMAACSTPAQIEAPQAASLVAPTDVAGADDASDGTAGPLAGSPAPATTIPTEGSHGAPPSAPPPAPAASVPSPVREPIEPAPVDLDAISDVEWAVRQTWPEDPETAVKVARCESGLRPEATGASGERGVMQLHPVHRARVEDMGYTWAQMHDLMPNLAVARAIWDEQGWGPWTCAA